MHTDSWLWQQVQTTNTSLGAVHHTMAAMHLNGVQYIVVFGGYTGKYLNTAQFLNLRKFIINNLNNYYCFCDQIQTQEKPCFQLLYI